MPAEANCKVAIGPTGATWFAAEAVAAGGGVVVPVEEAEALVWMDFADAGGLAAVLAQGPGIRWVQLPWAGVEAFHGLDLFGDGRQWTCGKGIYAEEVAELAHGMIVACLRGLPELARRTTWDRDYGQTAVPLHGRRVVILGGGGIAEALIRLLAPWRCPITVVRRHVGDAVPGADRVVGTERLAEVLPEADVLVLALALTPETRGIISADQLALVPEDAVLVNVARGGHVDSMALVEALAAGRLRGAGLDVTDPEPLPDGHPLWAEPRCILTPHTANTIAMAKPVLFARIQENVRRFAAGEPLIGPIDSAAGY